MTGENEFLYLDREDYERLHEALAEWAKTQDEPIPPFALAKAGDIESLASLPRRSFFGQAAYPTLAEKAAIIFYTINKRQIFLNGNKRMSTLALVVFLRINGYGLEVPPDDLTEKAIWLAKTESLDFPDIKAGLIEWIQQHLRPA